MTPTTATSKSAARTRGILALVGPGVLVAATGVGAGDLATAGLVGSALGLGVLWAVVLGAAAKLVLNENLARWQIATGQTVLEGAVVRLGWLAFAPFAIYLVAWSYFVGSALISACGITADALCDALLGAGPGVALGGAACSIAGLALAWLGGFKLFERVMAVCIGVMVVIVLAAAVLVRPDPAEMLSGLLVPRIPDEPGAIGRTVALVGGVGGTLTIICYSYWMREAGRTTRRDLGRARLDIALGYAMTALFGVAMIVIASGVELTGGGAGLIVQLADRLADALRPTLGDAAASVAGVAFLVGAFGAVFSSLLGVWQAVPYVAADLWNLRRHIGVPPTPDRPIPAVSTRSGPYRIYLVLIATVPMLGLFTAFETVQLAYAFFGALFVPALGVSLLALNNRRAWIGAELRNRVWSNAALTLAVLIVGVAAAFAIADRL